MIGDFSTFSNSQRQNVRAILMLRLGRARAEAMNLKERWVALSSEQRFALGVFSLCGILALGLSVHRFYTRIHEPWLVPNTVLDRARQFNARLEAEANKNAALQKKDTDRDGLSDFIELEVYKTSPYLADSDSDAVPDSVEIAQGEDPNCPRGRDCASVVAAVVQPSASSSLRELLEVTEVPKGVPDALVNAASSTVGASSFIENPPPPASMTPATIRQFLVRNNLVTQQQLVQLDDSMVVQLYTAAYQEALRVQSAQKKPVNP
jgi:hypothetical protein